MKYLVKTHSSETTIQVEAGYWIERSGTLIFLEKVEGQQYDRRVAAFAPGEWSHVISIPVDTQGSTD